MTQLKVVPVPEKTTAVETVPLQSVWLVGEANTVGVGLTVTTKVLAVPVQPAADGVTVTVELFAVLPVLRAVNEDILPVPEDGRPIVLLLFVQL